MGTKTLKSYLPACIIKASSWGGSSQVYTKFTMFPPQENQNCYSQGTRFYQQVFLGEQPGTRGSPQPSGAVRLLPRALHRKQSCRPEKSTKSHTLGIQCSSSLLPSPRLRGHKLPSELSEATSACTPVSGSEKALPGFLGSPSRRGFFTRAQQTVFSYTQLSAQSGGEVQLAPAGAPQSPPAQETHLRIASIKTSAHHCTSISL